ncbi:MAG: phosphoribosyltransferase [Candidatus Nanohaloarchaeota archaeon QJJ-9]|nr:phosphoribosyltransferase [Candidatus Nanohaloarchaeota archaeon QJJ-9]
MGNKQHLAYGELEKAINELYREIEESGFSPDSVVSIHRGGDPLGIRISHRFNIPQGIVNANHYDGEERQEIVEIQGKILEPVEGDVILVDDIVDTGKTMEEVEKKLEGYEKVDCIKTASIHTKERTVYKPDFTYSNIDSSIWIVYPWEE